MLVGMEIVQAGHPLLRVAAPPVARDDLGSLGPLVADMVETLRAAPGVGLAANQVARPERLAVIEDRAEYHTDLPPSLLAEQERAPFDLRVLVNPVYEPVGTEVAHWFEACLSVQGYAAIVPRWRRVRLSAVDVGGEPVTLELSGWPARVVQHEVDHLDGMLYVDRMLTRSFVSREAYLATWRHHPIAGCLEAFGIAAPGA
jgi:peptide deformylase